MPWLLAFMLLPSIGAAQQVSVMGTASHRALIAVDGSQPRFLSVGEEWAGVRLLRVQGDEILVEVAGTRQTLRLGQTPLAATVAPQSVDARTITLTANANGHFTTRGQINGRSVEFLVDTGATALTLSLAEARRIGLDISRSSAVRIQTANGEITGHHLQLSTVQIGGHTSHQVDAVVVPSELPYVLLGNSYLSRFDMKRENVLMTLTPRR